MRLARDEPGKQLADHHFGMLSRTRSALEPAPNGQNVNLKDLLIAGAARLILSESILLFFNLIAGECL